MGEEREKKKKGKRPGENIKKGIDLAREMASHDSS
jgi:hypothetical protein